MKQTILLVQPENPEIRRFRSRQFNNFTQITMPYLAAFIDESRYDITLVDEYHQQIPRHRSFDLVAVTVNTPNAPHCYDISRTFREKGGKVVFGGPHATLRPEEVREHCDYLLTGECEETWPLFLKEFREGNAAKHYVPDKPPDLAKLPYPRWDLLKGRRRIMKGAVIATRGCPHHCRFCNLKQIYFDHYRVRPVSEVIGEIRRMPSRFFVFWDDNFFADKQYSLALLQELSTIGKRWAAQVTLADCMDETLLAAARKAGCLYLFVGLESFSPGSLADAGKTMNRLDDYKTIIDRIHAHKIMVQAGIVFGFENDEPEVFTHTLQACERLGIDGATVSILTPLPQTPIYRQLKAENRLLTDDWSAYNGKTRVVYMPKNMTAEELHAGYMNFRKKFYSAGSFFRRMRVSKTHLLYNLLINLGYRLAMGR
ncbi:MAG: B12-binding domain-containing radical SAM protein [Planctomycetaceae bacterium]|nr:B12-binding domain-containing radical SAM protein [Planctomycetaceae bacterium]